MTKIQFLHIEPSEKEHMPINVSRFSCRNSSDEDCVFAGLKKFFACSLVFKFVIE